jgi:hypothetical protein
MEVFATRSAFENKSLWSLSIDVCGMFFSLHSSLESPSNNEMLRAAALRFSLKDFLARRESFLAV